MQHAYVDESGYTGRDLLNTQQPLMVLSALFISEAEAMSLRSKYFPRLRAPELKHQALARRPAHWDALLGLQRECLERHRGISFVAEKRYLCVLKMLDDCIEPVFHAHGVNFYQEGHHVALASLLCLTGPTSFGREQFAKLLRLYQRASRSKSATDIDAFASHARSLVAQESGEILVPIAYRDPVFVAEISSPGTSTNVAASMLSGLISQLEVRANGPYRVIHDASPAMRAHHGVLQALAEADTQVSFRVSDVAALNYPLHLASVDEGDSAAETGLQLADILAGGVAVAAKSLFRLAEPNAYNSHVIPLYSESNFMHMVPQRDLTEVKEAFANSQAEEAIKFVANAVANRGNAQG